MSRKVSFLHIGKTGGSQIGHLLGQLNGLPTSMVFEKHSHDVFLRDLPPDEPYFFSIRRPVSRFVSGFYSRKRKGVPHTFHEWSVFDAIAFREFEHANDLAEALFETGAVGHMAWSAMKSLRHTAQNQSDWFCIRGNFLRARPPVHILRQERLADDFAVLLRKIGLVHHLGDLVFSDDPAIAHSFDYDDVPRLSEKAVSNLQAWYAQDVVLYDMCHDWIERDA